MNETRLEKFKNYRRSLNEVKANSQQEEVIQVRQQRTVTQTLNTTSTLPLDEVLGKIDEHQERLVGKRVTRRSLGIAAFIVTGILLVVGIVIFAIYAFGGGN
ncbi:MAG: hypothetical protein GXY27_02985 [Erysipelotrichaceae bacterium]|jgi:hypothetical protein|nr:hypothetical protein [Erysipelotrichaceae bacterium]